ncbi:MAG TPA: aromatic ring-hydroxylating dioxygenase subunit alpha, partial [Candidatus Baltobacteraceae bacterium]|nr:aromatic ring-hydroxylating dioxygenase subunit alpha [Candidatus Baltobacteraceae bacterium]
TFVVEFEDSRGARGNLQVAKEYSELQAPDQRFIGESAWFTCGPFVSPASLTKELRMATEASGAALEHSLPKTAYVATDFYEREQRAIFWSDWVYAGRAESLPAEGAYQVVDIAGESIIVIRDHEQRLHAHVNLCRHRGSRLLCGADTLRGAIRCPYHGWSYALDGRLIASPFIEREAIPEQARHLHTVAVEQWGGFIFVKIAQPGAGDARADLFQKLGGIPERLARYGLADLRTAVTLEYRVAANWKVLLENYNECYHCAGVHPELCQIVPAFKRGGANLDWERGIPHRSGAFTFSFTGTSARRAFPALSQEERVRHNGELIYPNFMLSLSADHVAAFRVLPDGPERTFVRCDFLFHPDEVARKTFDPRDAVEFWDLVNRQDWAICERVQDGMQSRFFEYGYYAPMEDASLDIRRYIAGRLGL